MLRRGLRPGAPSLRRRLEAAELGIVPTPPELEDPPAMVAADTVRAFQAAADGMIAGLKAELADAKAMLADEQRERAAQHSELVRTRQLLEETNRPGVEPPEPPEATTPEPAPAGADIKALAADQARRLLEQVKAERDEARRNFHEHLAECTGRRSAKEGLDLTGSLRAANQRLRGELRTETDRADRAEAAATAAELRVAGLELTVQCLAQAYSSEEKPRVVVVDGAELVVPWGSRA